MSIIKKPAEPPKIASLEVQIEQPKPMKCRWVLAQRWVSEFYLAQFWHS